MQATYTKVHVEIYLNYAAVDPTTRSHLYFSSDHCGRGLSHVPVPLTGFRTSI